MKFLSARQFINTCKERGYDTAGIVRVMREFELTLDQALELSDHINNHRCGGVS